ncbi:MAG: hypothetical protein KatS3mg131_3883 [Candidatus Tectimicrobiota bacterium]|nr:MAG: hypothetical protein KatS3mg131_3883 [Candidatus Tectomicrobia bacterium]
MRGLSCAAQRLGRCQQQRYLPAGKPRVGHRVHAVGAAMQRRRGGRAQFCAQQRRPYRLAGSGRQLARRGQHLGSGGAQSAVFHFPQHQNVAHRVPFVLKKPFGVQLVEQLLDGSGGVVGGRNEFALQLALGPPQRHHLHARSELRGA